MVPPDLGELGTPVTDPGLAPADDGLGDDYEAAMAAIDDEDPSSVVNDAADPVDAPVEGEVKAEPAVAPVKTTEPELFDLTVNGQAIRATKDQMVQWAQQGRNYPQAMEKARTDIRAEVDTEYQAKLNEVSQYKTVDDLAKSDPNWWNYITQQYDLHQSGQAPQPIGEGEIPAPQPVDPRIQQELQTLRQYQRDTEAKVEADRAATEAREAKAQDDQVTKDINTTREAHKTLDWLTVDTNGHTLEQRVMQHALDNNIGNFQAAFRDMHHESLIKSAQDKFLEKQQKIGQSNRKKGIITRTVTPRQTNSSDPSPDIANKSWHQVEEMALAEYDL